MGGRELSKRDRAELERIRDDPQEPRFNRILANEALAQHGVGPVDLDGEMQKMIDAGDISIMVGDPATGEWVCACCIGYTCPRHGGEA